MALTELYVDPAINANSGSGTVGDPYGDLRYCIEQETFDTTNGVRINIKAGTSEILNEQLDVTMADTGTSVAWVPTSAAPLVFQGYTSAADDGGIGVIDGNASIPIFNNNATPDYITFRDLRLTNTGANDAITLDDAITLINCEIDTITGQGLDLGADALVLGCYFHDITNNCGKTVGPGLFMGNVVDGRGITITNSRGLFQNANDMLFFRNAVIVDGDAVGIQIGTDAYMMSNSVFGVASAKVGLQTRSAVAGDTIAIMNNLVAGFSASGGIGIDGLSNAGNVTSFEGGNSVHDCATNYRASLKDWVSEGVESLSASPFNDPANLDFAPVDTGSVSQAIPASFHAETHVNNVLSLYRGAVEPSDASPGGNQLALWRGAVQPAAGGGGGGGGQAKSGPGLSFGMIGKLGAG